MTKTSIHYKVNKKGPGLLRTARSDEVWASVPVVAHWRTMCAPTAQSAVILSAAKNLRPFAPLITLRELVIGVSFEIAYMRRDGIMRDMDSHKN